jgi:phage-related protein
MSSPPAMQTAPPFLTVYSDITILAVVMTDEPPLKPVIWVGSSLKDLRKFPGPVQDHVGYALYVAQRGDKHRDTKTLAGFGGAGVVEVISDYRGDTFRAVYTVRYASAVYVLHAFQKKSKTGRETPRRDLDLIQQRLREAARIAGEEQP